MTYSVQTASDINDIPALVVAFAGARGWAVDGAKITRPGGGRQFEITSTKAALTGFPNNPWRVLVTDVADPTARSVFCNVPIIGGPYSPPAPSAPTKVHMFGNNTPWDEEGQVAPWLGIVIEFGYNHYRHIYIGNMVKFGNYTGGEVISANSSDNSQYNGSAEINRNIFASSLCRWLFSAQYNGFGELTPDYPSGPKSGGINIVHADNDVPWRRFYQPAPDNNLYRNMRGDMAFGGVKDGAIAGSYLRRGVSDFAGADILIPYTMFCPDGTDDLDYRIRPLGFIAGPRAVDMRNIQSEASISVGNRNWRVFAEFQRNADTNQRRTAGVGSVGTGWDSESSQYVGVAYPETDE